MSLPEIITGNACIVVVDLTKNGATFVIGGTAVVKATLISTDHLQIFLSTAITVSSATAGSNWAASRVAISFPSTTSSITYQGEAKLEIKVTESGLSNTWFSSVMIRRGNI
jgi:hypothetical protein